MVDSKNSKTRYSTVVMAVKILYLVLGAYCGINFTSSMLEGAYYYVQSWGAPVQAPYPLLAVTADAANKTNYLEKHSNLSFDFT